MSPKKKEVETHSHSGTHHNHIESETCPRCERIIDSAKRLASAAGEWILIGDDLNFESIEFRKLTMCVAQFKAQLDIE